jgi:hypothetical protein
MPIIYLRHPVHGEKVAIAEEEAIADEENGWVRFTHGEVTAEPSNAIVSRRRLKVENDDLQRIRPNHGGVETPRSVG